MGLMVVDLKQVVTVCRETDKLKTKCCSVLEPDTFSENSHSG